jgi:hypothetical protein
MLMGAKLRLAMSSVPGYFPRMEDRIADDARFALLAKVRQARMMSEEERIVAGIRMFSGVCDRMKEGIRDDSPEAAEEEVHRILLQRLVKLRRLTRHPSRLP